MGVRIAASHHTTCLVNSAGHIWGARSWNTNDLSKNNWWVSIVAFGEGWHNNHHAFQYSARQGLEWWQIDITWYIVKFLEAMGLAHEVKLPNLLQMQKLAIKSM
ncbi:Palmitoyl-monogalactosyldiacylglycerol delta-7 desaturase, chloroplastic [Linum perenne]